MFLTTALAAADPAGIHHVVGRGQTLWRIARAYAVPLDELARVNRIDDPTQLDAGRSLWIPGALAPLDVPAYPAPIAAGPAPVFVLPVSGGRILSHFGEQRGRAAHKGLDIAGQIGDEVLAARDGVVVYSGSSLRGYGKAVILDHGDGFTTLYAHAKTLLVNEGDQVRQGQPIARVGRSGNATGPHCHFEIRQNDVPLDPLTLCESVVARR